MQSLVIALSLSGKKKIFLKTLVILWWFPKTQHGLWSEVKDPQSYPTLCNPMDYLFSPWNSPGQNTGVGSLSLFQGIFPTQGSNSGLPHYRRILYHLSHQESPRILEWVAYPFSRGTSQPRNRTGVFCIAGGFFTSWATRESWLKNNNKKALDHWNPSIHLPIYI